MNALMLLAAIALSWNVLVLRTGERLPIDGTAEQRDGRIVFQGAGGHLFSIPIEEVDLSATTAASVSPSIAAATAAVAKQEQSVDRLPLKVTEAERKRLIAELEQNHSGTQPPVAYPGRVQGPPPENTEEEWAWRNHARQYEEAIRQAKENLEMLQNRADALRTHITSLFSLGYRPWQFEYDSGQLQMTLEQIPYAELDVKRAERAYAEFRDEARRRDITPGWLR